MNKKKQQVKLAIKDIYEGTFTTHLWLHLSWMDIKQRYRRSTLGPFWITASMGIMIIAIGPLYGRLLNNLSGSYIQYLSISLVIWNLISTQITESCSAFILSEDLIKQVRLPLTIHLNRVLSRNIIIFAHNFVIVLIILYFFPPQKLIPLLLFPLALLLVIINLSWISLMLSTVSTRFRDTPLAAASIMQLFFFLTPVIWMRKSLPANADMIVDYNIFYHFIEIIRSPLLGLYPSTLTWAVTSITAFIGWILAFIFFSRFRSRVAYWV